jgi:glycosyltransferase involved in cell wall biosynthesis
MTFSPTPSSSPPPPAEPGTSIDDSRRPVRILYHFRSRGTGAEAVHIAGIAGAFQRLGHSVSFESPTGADPFQSKGKSPYQRNHRSAFPGITDLFRGIFFELLEIGYNAVAASRIKKRLRKETVDLIYERHAFFLWQPSALARRRKIPMVIEVNELVGDERVRAQPCLSWLARWSDRIAFRNASLITVVSPHLKRRIVAQGIPEEKILILPNAVDEREYSYPREGKLRHERFDLPTESLLIGFIGWFVPWHQLDRLIRCFASIAPDFPSARLVLVGEGELQKELEQLITSLGICDRVSLPGAVPHTEIPDLLTTIDVCIVPQSNSYRSPIKLFEYMASGRAVIAPRTEPIEMVATDGEDAILFDPDSAEDLTRALRILLDDASLREKLGRAARERVLNHHTWLRNAELVLGSLFDLTADPSPNSNSNSHPTPIQFP